MLQVQNSQLTMALQKKGKILYSILIPEKSYLTLQIQSITSTEELMLIFLWKSLMQKSAMQNTKIA